MDPASAVSDLPTEEQDWDADDFEIPSLKVKKQQQAKEEINGAKRGGTARKDKAEIENIYLGPHGAPPAQLKQQELNSASGKKNKRKQKLKEAEKKGVLAGRENKVDSIRDLMGSKGSSALSNGSQRDWLDPHCQESQFERPT